jgi:hypothetical protein
MVDRLERIVIMLQTHVRKVSTMAEHATLVQTTHELKGEQRTADAVAKQLMQWTNSIETRMKSRHTGPLSGTTRVQRSRRNNRCTNLLSRCTSADALRQATHKSVLSTSNYCHTSCSFLLKNEHFFLQT